MVGQRTQMGVWELLSVMFVAEAVFGPAGLVAAPPFYAYLKNGTGRRATGVTLGRHHRRATCACWRSRLRGFVGTNPE